MWKSVHGYGSWPGTWSRSCPHGAENDLWWAWNHSSIYSWAHPRAGLAHGTVCVCNTQGGIETGWHLRPGTLCCNACTWTNISSSYKIQRHYKALKITACMRSWGKFWTKGTQRPENPTATSEEPGAKTKRWEQKQGTAHAPCTQHHQRDGQTT